MRGFPFWDTHLIFIFFDTPTIMGDIVIPISHTHLIYMYFASGAEIYILNNMSHWLKPRLVAILFKIICAKFLIFFQANIQQNLNTYNYIKY